MHPFSNLDTNCMVSLDSSLKCSLPKHVSPLCERRNNPQAIRYIGSNQEEAVNLKGRVATLRIDSSKMTDDLPQVLNTNWLNSNTTGASVTSHGSNLLVRSLKI